MPWLTIIMFLITFFAKKKDGATNGEAAMWGAGVAGATYLAADPANTNNWFGVNKDTPILGALAPGDTVTPGSVSNLPSTGGSGGSWFKDLPSWVAPAVGVGVGASVAGKPWLLWAGAAVAALLLLR